MSDKISAFIKKIKPVYVILAVILVLALLSCLGSQKTESYSYSEEVDLEDIAASGYEIEGNTFTSVNNDPKIYLPASETEVNLFLITFSEPLTESYTAQLYYSMDESGLSEDKSVCVDVEPGDDSVTLVLPEKTVYTQLRFDMSGTFSIESIQMGCAGYIKSVTFNYKCFGVILAIVLVCGFLCIIFSKKIDKLFASAYKKICVTNETENGESHPKISFVKKSIMPFFICLALGIAASLSVVLIMDNEPCYGIPFQINSEGVHVGEITQDVTISQTFLSTNDKLSGIGLKLATFKRVNDCEVLVRLIDKDANSVIRESKINAEILNDNSFFDFTFDSVSNSKDKEYEIQLTTNAENANSITLLTTKTDTYSDGELTISGERTGMDAAFRPIYDYKMSSPKRLCILLIFTALISAAVCIIRKQIIQCFVRFVSSFKILSKKSNFGFLWHLLTVSSAALFVCSCPIALSRYADDNANSIAKIAFFSLVLLGVIIFIDLFFVLKVKDASRYFLLVSLTMCLIFSFTLPIKTGICWDDQIHYSRSLALADNLSNNVYISNADQAMCDVPFHGTNLFEYNSLRLDTINSLGNELVPTKSSGINYYTYIGYFPTALIMILNRAVGFRFSTFVFLARFVNGLIYSIIIFNGMKKLTSGKLIMSCVALLPTSLYLASNFTYDFWVTAFLMYSFSYYLSIKQKKGIYTTKDTILILSSIILGCGPKAVYCFAVIPYLFTEKCYFSSQKSKNIFRILSLFTILLIFASFLLPFITNSGAYSDARQYDDVNSSMQLSHIIHNPFTYAKTLLKFLSNYFSAGMYISYCGSMYHLCQNTPNIIATILISLTFFATLFDKSESDDFHGWKAFKYQTFLSVFIVLCFICTALYISYTSVGSNSISGVQWRYTIPILFPFLYAVGDIRLIKNSNPEKYIPFVFLTLLLSAALLYYKSYIHVLVV